MNFGGHPTTLAEGPTCVICDNPAEPCHACGEPVCERKDCQRLHYGLDGGLMACGPGCGR